MAISEAAVVSTWLEVIALVAIPAAVIQLLGMAGSVTAAELGSNATISTFAFEGSAPVPVA